MANRLNVGSDVQDKLKKDTVRQLESLFEEVRDERLPTYKSTGTQLLTTSFGTSGLAR